MLTHMPAGRRVFLSTSDARREAVIQSAIIVFAASGYLGTPVTRVAKHARISQAYVFKLFPTKQKLFVAALQRCFELIQEALATGAKGCKEHTPDAILFSMGGAYASLISNRDLLLLQIHAQSVANIPEIAKPFRTGLRSITKFVKARSGASDEAVQRFMAYGQLCHLITTMQLDDDNAPWARILTHGFRHQ